jgi:outer membrane protein assembly factor BamE
MHKRLAIITCFSGLMLGACSIGDWGLVHRIDIQQGNVISQDALNQLNPGMTRRQVQYVIGSPMVADTFHKDRWDYIYRLKPGKGEVTTEHVTLFFDADTLASISGSMHPQDIDAQDPSVREQVTLVVPPEERIPPGLLNRFWHWVTFRDIDKSGMK